MSTCWVDFLFLCSWACWWLFFFLCCCFFWLCSAVVVGSFWVLVDGGFIDKIRVPPFSAVVSTKHPLRRCALERRLGVFKRHGAPIAVDGSLVSIS